MIKKQLPTFSMDNLKTITDIFQWITRKQLLTIKKDNIKTITDFYLKK